jgi:hypothetical protein
VNKYSIEQEPFICTIIPRLIFEWYKVMKHKVCHYTTTYYQCTVLDVCNGQVSEGLKVEMLWYHHTIYNIINYNTSHLQFIHTTIQFILYIQQTPFTSNYNIILISFDISFIHSSDLIY